MVDSILVTLIVCLTIAGIILVYCFIKVLVKFFKWMWKVCCRQLCCGMCKWCCVPCHKCCRACGQECTDSCARCVFCIP